jgi:hypothetical protein
VISRGYKKINIPQCCISTLLSPSKVNWTSYSVLAAPTRLSVFKPWPPHASQHSCKSIQCTDERLHHRLMTQVRINKTPSAKAKSLFLPRRHVPLFYSQIQKLPIYMSRVEKTFASGQNCCQKQKKCTSAFAFDNSTQNASIRKLELTFRNQPRHTLELLK